MRTYLLIGGCRAGERVELEDWQDRVVLHERMTAPDFSKPFPSIPYEKCARVSTYHLVSINYEPQRGIKVLVAEDTNALEELVKNYRPIKTPQETARHEPQ